MLKKIIVSLLTISLIFNLIVIDNYTFAEFKDEIKAPINLVRNLEKNQYQVGDEFIINYTIQPQNLAIEDVYPEYYLVDKEIVLVMDISGSMNDPIYMNQNKEAIKIREYIGKIESDIYRYKVNIEYMLLWWYTTYTEDLLKDIEENLEGIKESVKGLKTNKQRINRELKKIDNYIKSIRDSLEEIKANKNVRRNKSEIQKNIDNIMKSTEKIKKLLKINKIAKIEAMKFVAKRFLEKLKDDERIKVNLIPYETKAWDSSYDGKDFADLSDIEDYNELIRDIDRLEPYGGTNIGDGLRKAYYKLKNSPNKNARKYIILMTDGQPTAFSYDKIHYKSIFGTFWSKEYYELAKVDVLFYLGNELNYRAGDGTLLDDNLDLKYAKLVGEKLIKNGGLEIKSFMIGFSNDANMEKLKQIADSSGGYFKKAEDGNALDEVYQTLADEICSDLPIHSVLFKETIPAGFDILDVSEGLQIEGNTVIGNIGSITYRLDKERKEFIAEPINFWIKVKANRVGKYKFGNIEGENESYVKYKDIDGKDRIKYFPVIDISVYETDPPILNAELFIETDSAKLLNISVNEPSFIEILYNDEIIDTIDCREDSFETGKMKKFTIELQQDIQDNSLVIIATDLSGNKVRETVPYLNLTSVKLDEYEHNDLNRPVELELSTESNSIIKDITINGTKVQENKVTDEGLYTANVLLRDGLNDILVTVKNQYNNITCRTFKVDIDAKSPVINAELEGFKLMTNFDEEVKEVWIEADLNNDGIISEDEIFDKNDINISYNESHTEAYIILAEKFSNKQIKIKAKDMNGNIGFLTFKIPKLDRILDHGLLVNSIQLKKYEDNSINIVNGYEVKIGAIFSIDSEANTLTLHLNKDGIDNVKLLGEFKFDLYVIDENSIIRRVAVNQRDVNIQSSDNEIVVNIDLGAYSDIFENKLLFVYNFKPLVENLDTRGISILNSFSIGESIKDLKVNIKHLPKIE
ncbi:von Willebrand factor type A domain-containing protein [Caloranaerobacter azorensis DSM 13643]|uniref:von Willebrand factor type A domain-containing protein n=1 Tax=Caloranaerobacter azorensis DSM 13643 TaxID=1121264 RepID=A0A1M5RWG1_9FIRM|nr:vWA domain-containing protein [Caloranaerobacter azorensis]SHH30662.1 von Willebrand factor type A domain-containing protein [Caloranaerobacter azorensis DSM 13643]